MTIFEKEKKRLATLKNSLISELIIKMKYFFLITFC